METFKTITSRKFRILQGFHQERASDLLPLGPGNHTASVPAEPKSTHFDDVRHSAAAYLAVEVSIAVSWSWLGSVAGERVFAGALLCSVFIPPSPEFGFANLKLHD